LQRANQSPLTPDPLSPREGRGEGTDKGDVLRPGGYHYQKFSPLDWPSDEL